VPYTHSQTLDSQERKAEHWGGSYRAFVSLRTLLKESYNLLKVETDIGQLT